MVYDKIKYMNEELIKKIKESPFFTEFKDYLYEKIYDLNSIQGFDKKSNLEVGETVKARAIAVGILQDILHPFVNITNKKIASEEEIKKRSKDFGL